MLKIKLISFQTSKTFNLLLADHNWFVAKMKIAQIAMIDWFGGAKYIPVNDYLAYNYTGTEILDHHHKVQQRHAVAAV